MKLKSIAVQNYRSIVKTTKLELDPGLTVILGPNNEGKSNLLRAIKLVMECFRAIGSGNYPVRSSPDGPLIRVPHRAYDWGLDFPLAAQERDSSGNSTLLLDFQLSNDERRLFGKQIGIKINEKLPIELSVGSRWVRLKVKKQGKGASKFKEKTHEIARFISERFDFEYIPTFRPSELSLEVVSSLIQRELAKLEEDPDYQAALMKINELQQPLFSQLEADVETYLKKILPSVNSVKIAPQSRPPYGYRTRFHSPQFIVDDGTATDLDAKGDGVKSLVAISLVRATKASRSLGDLVVAIEEPELHLHPEAIRELTTVLRDMAKEHQVIITTHSPLLVARNRMSANIIVSNSTATPASSIQAVRDSLGVKAQDSLEAAEYVILVEGKTDVRILSALFSTVSSELAEHVATGKLVVDHLQGAGNISSKVSYLRSIAATTILILDDDQAGRSCARKARYDASIEDKYIFYFKRSGHGETEIEDTLNPDCYWSKVESVCGVKLDRQSFEASDGKWSARMKMAFERSGKSWSSSTETNAKNAVACCAVSAGSAALTEDGLSQLESIASAVSAIIEGTV
jgi:putative ATP-dependent endonuclease of the OLD family